MSTLGIDTSQLISQFTTSESQKEWNELEAALLEAFPGKTMEEIHAAASLYVAQNSDATFDELVSYLSQHFAISLSTELATEIRNEWDEFSTTSDLTPAELLAVLDDYDGDSVDTKSRAYLMFLVQELQQKIEDLTAKEATAGQEADRAQYEVAKEEYNEKVAEQESKSSGWGKVLTWLGAAAAVIGAVVAVVVAAAVTIGTGGAAGALAITAAVIACTLAVSAVAGAATDGEYSIAGLTAKLMEACGVDEQTAAWIGMGVEIVLAVAGLVCSLGAGFAASAGTATSTATNVASTATKTATTTASTVSTATEAATNAAKAATALKDFAKILNFCNAALMVATGVASGAKAIVDYNYAMDQAELLELQALLEKMLAIIKAGQELDQQMLQAIFDSLRGMVIENQSEYLDVLQNMSNVDMA